MSTGYKFDRKYAKYSILLILLVIIEFVFYFYIKPVKMYLFISNLKYITINISTRKETFISILYIILFSLFYGGIITSYQLTFRNEKYSIARILKESISNWTVFLSTKIFLLITIDSIYSLLDF